MYFVPNYLRNKCEEIKLNYLIGAQILYKKLNFNKSLIVMYSKFFGGFSIVRFLFSSQYMPTDWSD